MIAQPKRAVLCKNWEFSASLQKALQINHAKRHLFRVPDFHGINQPFTTQGQPVCKKGASSRTVKNTLELLKLQPTLFLWGDKKAWGWTWHPAQAACPGEARFWPAQQLWKQTASSGVPESSCPAPAVQRIMVHTNARIRRAWKISRCLSVLGTHWHLSWLSRSWGLRQLLPQHHTNSNMAISPFPSKPSVTASATSIFYSSLHKPAHWGQCPRCGNALRPQHISSWRNQGWDTSFSLPFLHLQSGTSTSLWHRLKRIHFWMPKASISDSKGSRDGFSKWYIKVRMHSSQ